MSRGERAGLWRGRLRGYNRIMSATRADLFARLAELGIETETHEHPPVFTVEEARAHCAHLPGDHCKSLFFMTTQGPLCLRAPPAHRVLALKK